MLIQKINRFERTFSSGKIAELILIYIALPKEDDLKEPKRILKFTKVSDWIPFIIPEKSKNN